MAVQLLFLLLASPVVAVVAFLLLQRKKNKTLNLPPGHLGGWPVIGETIPFMQPHPSASLGSFVDQRVAKYGQIFRMSLLGKPTIVSVDPEFNRFVLQNGGRLFETSYPKSVVEIMGKTSMLVHGGETHRQMRSLVVAFMSNAKLPTFFLSGIESRASELLDSWPTDGSVFSAQEEGRKFTFNVIVKQLMSLEAGTSEAEQLRSEYRHFMKGMNSLPINLPGTAYRKALQSRDTILNIMGQKLEQRIKKQRDGFEGQEEEGDFLASASKHPNLSREQILDFMLNMLFGGHETGSAAIALVIYFLDSCPAALQQLREEHSRIARLKKHKGEKRLNWDDYKLMDFTQCVINETLRLGNIIKFVYRRAIKDVEFRGYEIPCGWDVLPILSAAHLDPSIFDDPQRYNPWRWEAANATVKNKNNIMFFSGGPRYCPGAELARLEIAVFIHHLLQKYHFEMVECDNPVSKPFFEFPKGLPIKVRPLHQNIEDEDI